MHKTTNGTPDGPRRSRGCLIAVALAFAAVLALDAVDPPNGRQRAVVHNEGERYTVTAGATVCEELSDFHRILELLGDTPAFTTFLTASTCHVVQHPTEVVVEGHERRKIIRVRALGSITSWYMLEAQLE